MLDVEGDRDLEPQTYSESYIWRPGIKMSEFPGFSA